jgi:hypothetical protein
MAALFQYRPHVHRDGKVFTPDLLIAHARMRVGNKDLPLPIDRVTVEVTLQQVGDTAYGVAALVAVGGGAGPDQGPLLTVGSLHGAPDAPLACAKPVSRQAWRLADVADHLDRIVLRGWHVHAGTRTLATEETVSLAAGDLAAVATENLLFHGARAADAPETAAAGFAAELHDPVLDRSLRLAYSIEVLT